jgi:hypothetical protein
MTIEERLQSMIGAQAIEIARLLTQLEEAQTKIKILEEMRREQENGKHSAPA